MAMKTLITNKILMFATVKKKGKREWRAGLSVQREIKIANNSLLSLTQSNDANTN